MVDFNAEESQFLSNLLMERSQDANLAQYDQAVIVLLAELLSTSSPYDFNAQELGFLQYLMQEQSEIWGRQSSTANEKQPVLLGSFVPQKTRRLIKSISDKLGAKIPVDTLTPSFPISPRAEGSASIMQDPRLIK